MIVSKAVFLKLQEALACGRILCRNTGRYWYNFMVTSLTNGKIFTRVSTINWFVTTYE
jgi:hypothetical protein